MENFKLQSPWVIFYKEINALFEEDRDIKVVYNYDEGIINVFVDNLVKAKAMSKYLPKTKTFGNVTLIINVIPSNNGEKCDLDDIDFDVTIEDLFNGNPLYHFSKTFPEVFVNPITYVVFAKRVMQFYTDDLGDLYGNANCLAEDLARKVLVNTEGLFFSTDILED